MPRNQKKHPSQLKTRPIDDERLKAALDAISAGMTVRTAQAQFGISRSALHRYLQQVRLNPNKPPQVRKKGGQLLLPEELERELVSTVMLFSVQDNPLASMDLRRLVKSYLDRENLKIKKFKDNLPGYDWSHGFVARHGLADFMAGRTKRRKGESCCDDSLLEENPLEFLVTVEMDAQEEEPS